MKLSVSLLLCVLIHHGLSAPPLNLPPIKLPPDDGFSITLAPLHQNSDPSQHPRTQPPLPGTHSSSFHSPHWPPPQHQRLAGPSPQAGPFRLPSLQLEGYRGSSNQHEPHQPAGPSWQNLPPHPQQHQHRPPERQPVHGSSNQHEPHPQAGLSRQYSPPHPQQHQQRPGPKRGQVQRNRSYPYPGREHRPPGSSHPHPQQHQYQYRQPPPVQPAEEANVRILPPSFYRCSLGCTNETFDGQGAFTNHVVRCHTLRIPDNKKQVICNVSNCGSTIVRGGVSGHVDNRHPELYKIPI